MRLIDNASRLCRIAKKALNFWLLAVGAVLYPLLLDEIFRSTWIGGSSFADKNPLLILAFGIVGLGPIFLLSALLGKRKGVPVAREYSKVFPKFEATGNEPYSKTK